MSKPVWKATEDGNLVNLKSGAKIDIEEFTIEKGHRGEVIHITKKGGGTKNVLRFQVDESDFPFGPGGPEAAPAAAPKARKMAEPAVRTIEVTRDEAVALLKATQAAANMLMTKLIDETMSR